MAVGVTSVLGRLRLARFFATQLRDVVIVAVVCAVVVAVTRPGVLDGVVDPSGGTSVLAYVAAAFGAGAAIAASVDARVARDPRPAWIAAALALYGVFVLPLSTVMLIDPRNATSRLAAATMFVVAMVIMLIGLRPPPRLGSWGGWVLLAFGGALAAVIVSVPSTPVLLDLARGRTVPLVAVVGWAVVAVAYLIDGWRETNERRARLGLGILVVALSQLTRDLQGGGAPTDLVYPTLRAVGMGIVLLAVLGVVHRTVSRLESDYDQMQMQLSRVAQTLESMSDLSAERDHELRNGLIAMAGIAHVLSTNADDDDGERFRQMLLGELGRLREMINTPLSDQLGDDVDELDGSGWHLVNPVLEKVVALCVDQDVELRTDGELRAATEASVTEHIVLNLLRNCDRHAPGTAVVVRAHPGDDGTTVVIEVRDHGPGLPAGREEAVFDRGVRDETAGGTGLGLHISRNQAEQNGGTLTLQTVQNPLGCLAVLTLPSVPV